ncbi:DUF5719 family protein [Streptomyces sp. ODS28]|uniref:DUF5719 family protein n=1 Tax=Streptomyces sp. ODS28 TaxID=3136688 RepID=UPI0031EF785A
MNRSTGAAQRGARTPAFLIGAVAALAAVTGVAAMAAPGDQGGGSTAGAVRKPVERSTLVCPQPSDSDVAETAYTGFTPKGGSGKGEAGLYPAERARADGGKSSQKGGARSDKPVVPLKAPGTPVTSSVDSSGSPALVGSADGRFAPGWTVQQTTTVSAGAGRGLQGSACSSPDTDFWFPGASTGKQREDYVHLTNPDSTSAVVDLDMYGPGGRTTSDTGEGITVPPRSTVPVLLSTLTTEPVDAGTLHVVARNGRVGAQVQASDKKAGGDWLDSTADAAPSAVLPGIPEDASSVRLVVFAPGENDADLKLRLAGKNGRISPAGHETVHVKGGMSTAVDLKDLTKGEAGSLELTPADGGEATPVVAAAQVTRGKGGKQETAFVPATAPVDKRATAADNPANGKGSTLALTAKDKPAKVRVTASAGSDGGTPSSRTYTVKPGTTQSFPSPAPEGGKGSSAVTVERLSGGPVYASRMLEKKVNGTTGFTLQTLPDDRGSVPVPQSGQDLSVLNDD